MTNDKSNSDIQWGRIQSMLKATIEEAELLFGIQQAFPVTIEIARIIDDIAKRIKGIERAPE